jgi:carbamoyl-phosphate synthase large subunit
VLFTCAGQRVDVVRAFRAAMADLERPARIVCVDVHPLAPTHFVGDVARRVPPIASPDYVPALLDLVREHDVGAVLPLADLDAGVLAAAHDDFAATGATLFLPPAEVAVGLFDKYACHRLLTDRGIPSPDTWLPEELPADLPLPVLVKRRWGYASRDIHRCRTRAEIDFFVEYVDVPVMVQQLCTGEEFSIDVLCDLEGRALNAIPRTMIESKGGESIKGMTLRDDRLVEHGRLVAERLGLVGPATIQCFEEDGELLVTDINTRFGGAFPLPLAAGSRYPELVLRMAAGERPEPALGDYAAGVVMTRYFDTIVLPDAPAGSRELSLPPADRSAAASR